MTLIDNVTCIFVFVGLTGLVGHSFINAFFNRKEEIIRKLTEKGDV